MLYIFAIILIKTLMNEFILNFYDVCSSQTLGNIAVMHFFKYFYLPMFFQ